MKKITVVGTGYVGLVSGTCFAEIGNRIICCDIDEGKIQALNNGHIPIYEPGLKELVSKNVRENRLSFINDIGNAIKNSDIIYIAVGTPMAENGQANLKYVKEVAKTIGENLNSYKIIVNKSTVPVGTGELVYKIVGENSSGCYQYDVVSNPEFLREGSAIHDTLNMERAVIGATSEKAATIIEELHEPFQTNILKTDVKTAEMIKYASNAFLATKISFINDIATICEKLDADVTKVAEGMGLDRRIGKSFLNAGIGYGGSCFPKDTSALIHIANEVGFDFKLLKSVQESNNRQKNTVVEKLLNIFGEINDKKVTILGLAFKPNTDDMRDAPSLDVIPALLKRGALINAYDPIANEEAKRYLGNDIRYFNDLYKALEGAEVCIILTEHLEVKEMNLENVRQLMAHPIIIDGRNCFNLDEMKDAKFIYHSIGRPVVS